MKRSIILTALLTLFCIGISAQTATKKKTNRLQIKDVVNHMVEEPEGDVMGSVYEAWQNYLKGRPQAKNTKLTVDAKNGYFRYDNSYPEDGSTTTVEIVFWNRTDGKQLAAWNCYAFENGKPIQTECTFVSFSLYNPAKRTWEIVDDESIGIAIDESVVVYELPRQGKNITAKIYNGKKATPVTLKWTGLGFKR